MPYSAERLPRIPRINRRTIHQKKKFVTISANAGDTAYDTPYNTPNVTAVTAYYATFSANFDITALNRRTVRRSLRGLRDIRLTYG